METWLRTRPSWQLVAGVITACALALGMSVFNGFVSLDDGLLIYANPAILELTGRSLTHIFTSYDPELYVPLTLLSYQLEHAFFGLNPSVFHFTNVLLHSLSAVLVYCIGTMLTGRRTVGVFAALLFAVHPLNVEAVAWAAARKDVLSVCLCLASFASYLRWKERSAVLWLWLSCGLFALALMAKVSVIALPLLLLAMEWAWRADVRKAAVQLWPMWLLAAVFGLIALGGKSGNMQDIGPVTTLLLAIKSTAFYMWKLLLPFGLSPIYPQTTPVWIGAPDIVIAIIAVSVLLVATVGIARMSRELAFGLLWFLLALPPNFLNFLKDGSLYFASDRYAYLASIGVLLLVGMFVDWLLSTRQSRNGLLSTIGVIAAVLAVLAIHSAMQVRVWHSSETLYAHVLRLYPDSWVAWSNAGQDFSQRGKNAEALSAYAKALTLAPESPLVLVNIGNVYKRQGDTERAAEYYRRATQVHSGSVLSGPNLLIGFYYLGELEEARGNTTAALQAFEQAASRAPDVFDAQLNLGLQYQKRGMHAQAVDTLTKAVALRDSSVEARYRLASELAAIGRLTEALSELEAVERLDPAYENVQQHLQGIRQLLSSSPGA